MVHPAGPQGWSLGTPLTFVEQQSGGRLEGLHPYSPELFVENQVGWWPVLLLVDNAGKGPGLDI